MQNDIVRRPVVRPQTKKVEGAAGDGKQDDQQQPVPARVEDVVRQTEDLPSPINTEQNNSTPDNLGGAHQDEQASSQADELPQEAAAPRVDQAAEPKKSGHGAVIAAAVFIFIALAGLAVYASLKSEPQENGAPQPAVLTQPETTNQNDPTLNGTAAETPSGLNVQP
jgi:hypothetical protein